MKKFLLLIIILIFFSMLIFLSQPKLRHIIFTGVIQFPEFATLQAMKGGLVTRDFNRVLPWLDRQYRLTNLYGKTKNKMTPGLLENIKKSYKFAVLQGERERFIPLLEKTYHLVPKNIDINLMLASAYQFSDEKKSLSYLNEAKLILPSDKRIFELANILLRDSKDYKLKKLWCDSYRKEQFGDYEDYKGSTLLGIGYRRIAFEFKNKDKRDLYLNEGVQLGKKIQYEFILGDSVRLISPSLRLSNGGGIEVILHNIELYAGGKKIKTYLKNSIELYPETGFFTNGKVISLNTQGENIFINLLDVNEFQTDKVLIELTINKLPLNNSSICNQ